MHCDELYTLRSWLSHLCLMVFHEYLTDTLHLVVFRLPILCRLKIHNFRLARSNIDTVRSLDAIKMVSQALKQATQSIEGNIGIGLPTQYFPQELLPL